MTPMARSFADGEVDVRVAIAEEDEREDEEEEDVKWVGDLPLIGRGCATGAVEDGAGAFLERPDSEAGSMLIDLVPEEEGVEPRYGEA